MKMQDGGVKSSPRHQPDPLSVFRDERTTDAKYRWIRMALKISRLSRDHISLDSSDSGVYGRSA
ncbi:hypothetical protein PGTUg99_032991 [Puccinia graminis f. sp. tritici]|nr:hypothetical protein PGTUg99_032991 [Puccinia graminis f. sp. tritici]